MKLGKIFVVLIIIKVLLVASIAIVFPRAGTKLLQEIHQLWPGSQNDTATAPAESDPLAVIREDLWLLNDRLKLLGEQRELLERDQDAADHGLQRAVRGDDPAEVEETARVLAAAQEQLRRQETEINRVIAERRELVRLISPAGATLAMPMDLVHCDMEVEQLSETASKAIHEAQANRVREAQLEIEVGALQGILLEQRDKLDGTKIRLAKLEQKLIAVQQQDYADHEGCLRSQRAQEHQIEVKDRRIEELKIVLDAVRQEAHDRYDQDRRLSGVQPRRDRASSRIIPRSSSELVDATSHLKVAPVERPSIRFLKIPNSDMARASHQSMGEQDPRHAANLDESTTDDPLRIPVEIGKRAKSNSAFGFRLGGPVWRIEIVRVRDLAGLRCLGPGGIEPSSVFLRGDQIVVEFDSPMTWIDIESNERVLVIRRSTGLNE